MKQMVSLILALGMCISLCACSKKAMMELPEYLRDEYHKTLSSVSEILKGNDDTVLIGVMTDLHFSPSGSDYCENTLRTGVFNAGKALSVMTEEVPFDMVAFLGDYVQLPYIDDGQTKEMGISCLMDVKRILSEMNASTMAIAGNHEGNYSGDGTGYGLIDEEVYDILLEEFMTKNNAVRHNNDCYIDDAANSIRHVFVDGRIMPENENTKAWLRDSVSASLPAGYSIVVYSHYSFEGPDVSPYVKNYIDAIIEGGHTPLLWIGGHWHSDKHDTYNGCLVVSLLQSGMWVSETSEDGVTYEHIEGTETESAFTCIVLNKAEKKVNLIRFGLGTDKEYMLP